MKRPQQQQSDDSIVLALIRRYQKPGDGIIWTSRMISEHTGLTPKRASVVLTRLVRSGQLVEKEGAYRIKENHPRPQTPGPTSGGFYVFPGGGEADRAAAQAMAMAIETKAKELKAKGLKPNKWNMAEGLKMSRRRLAMVSTAVGAKWN